MLDQLLQLKNELNKNLSSRSKSLFTTITIFPIMYKVQFNLECQDNTSQTKVLHITIGFTNKAAYEAADNMLFDDLIHQVNPWISSKAPGYHLDDTMETAALNVTDEVDLVVV